MLKTFVVMFCVAALFLVVPAAADQWDKKTTVTFSQPVELPGIVLPAGTYVFRLLDSAQNRHVVQVFNPEETRLYTTILAIPNWRLKPADETVMKFAERKAGQPEALRAWFYPADNFGQEFVYPKKRAVELATETRVPVFAAEVTPAEKAEELIEEPVVAVTPEQKEVEVAQVTGPAPIELPPVIAKAEPAPPAPIEELPKTASPLPLFILVGLGSLGIALVLRVVAKRAA